MFSTYQSTANILQLVKREPFYYFFLPLFFCIAFLTLLALYCLFVLCKVQQRVKRYFIYNISFLMPSFVYHPSPLLKYHPLKKSSDKLYSHIVSVNERGDTYCILSFIQFYFICNNIICMYTIHIDCAVKSEETKQNNTKQKKKSSVCFLLQGNCSSTLLLFLFFISHLSVYYVLCYYMLCVY